MMERGKSKLQNILEDDLGRDLMNAGRFCFSCEQIFANRKCLEEHFCSAASHICSCGTEFAEYKDVLDHSTTHEPGHQVLDHGTIQKRRIEKRIEEEQQLKRLQTGEVVWKVPKLNNVPSVSLLGTPLLKGPMTSALMPQVPMQSAHISQVPPLNSSLSQTPVLIKPIKPSEKDMQKMFAGVGAPTVDLWSLYQPVVILQTLRKFNKTQPYTCAKCGHCFERKTSLISHHSSHVIDKISGCIGCGLLLSSKKVVPRFHFCKAPNNTTKPRLITATPLNFKKPIVANTGSTPRVEGPLATSSQQLKSQSLTAARKGSRVEISTLQLKKLKISAHIKSNQGVNVLPRLIAKGPSSFSPYITSPLLSKNPHPRASNNGSQGLPVPHFVQLKTPTQSASGVSNYPMQTSSASNGFPCRVCHLPFESAQLLQRHKCARAKEFMAQHVRDGKRYRLKRVAPLTRPIPVLMNGERKPGVSAYGNIKTNQVMSGSLNKGQGAAPVDGETGGDMDDDCFIVESGPDKPAEMIYQVTSSVPITT